ncbi:MAG TPA: hypothetical protein PLS84_10545 [Salinivirgaceae bacterium]|nr:hypothetical protein [Salinivirgaceae bacterium]
MKYTIETKVIIEEDGTYTDEELEEKLKELLENVETGFGKVTCEDGQVVEVKK